MTKLPVVQPFVKWAGGKRQLLPKLREHLPVTHTRYYEPFVGGGALFFDQLPVDAMLSDANERLIRTYRGVRNDVEGVIALLETYPYEKDFFLEMRAINIDDTKVHDDAAAAAWFIYLNRACFNGMYRVNKANRFNVPFGRYENPTICDSLTLRAASKALKRVVLSVGGFEESTKAAVRGDLVYFDPPYVPLSVDSSFVAYTADGFGLADHTRLRDHARMLIERGVHVILSNSGSPWVREIYADAPFRIHEVQATRSVNSKTTSRGKITELIITAAA